MRKAMNGRGLRRCCRNCSAPSGSAPVDRPLRRISCTQTSAVAAPFPSHTDDPLMKPSMLAKLDQLSERLVEVSNLLMQEGVTSDMDQYRKLTREHAELGPLVELYTAYTQA